MRVAAVLVCCSLACPAQETRASSSPFDVQEVVRVVVLDAATKKPVADAEVSYLHEQDREQAQLLFGKEWRSLAYDLELRLARFGRGTTTDADGTAFVPRKGLEGELAIRKGDLYAQVGGAWLAGPPSLEVRLAASPSVSVIAHDPQGNPCAGVPVVVLRGQNPELGKRFPVGHTTADGTRVIPRIGQYANGQKLFVTALVLGHSVPAVEVDPAQPPRAPIELKLPETGSLLIRLRDPNDRPLAEHAHASVEALGMDPLRYPLPLRRIDTTPIPEDGGEIVIAALALGQRLRVTASAHVNIMAAELPGPATAQVQAEVVLRLDHDLPVLVGRALDQQDRPLRRQWLRGELKAARGGAHGSSSLGALTDSEGRFRVYVNRTLLHKDVTGMQLRLGSSSAACEPKLPFALVPGEIDLGDLKLEIGPLVLAGRVVLPKDSKVPPSMTIEELRDGRWFGYSVTRLLWLDGDKFEFRGKLDPKAELRLRVSPARPSMSESFVVDFELGCRDLVVEVPAARR